MELESWKVLLFWNLILPSLISLKESLGAQLSWQLLEFSWCSFLQSQNKALAWFSHIQDFWTFRKEGTFLLLGLYPSQIIHSILLFIHPSFCFRSNCVRPSLMKVEGPVYQLLCFLLLLCSVNLTSLWFFFFSSRFSLIASSHLDEKYSCIGVEWLQTTYDCWLISSQRKTLAIESSLSPKTWYLSLSDGIWQNLCYLLQPSMPVLGFDLFLQPPWTQLYANFEWRGAGSFKPYSYLQCNQ